MVTNPFTGEFVVNHPGHADQKVHGKDRGPHSAHKRRAIRQKAKSSFLEAYHNMIDPEIEDFVKKNPEFDDDLREVYHRSADDVPPTLDNPLTPHHRFVPRRPARSPVSDLETSENIGYLIQDLRASGKKQFSPEISDTIKDLEKARHEYSRVHIDKENV